MKTIKIEGQVYILTRTKKGWRYSKPNKIWNIADAELAAMFGIEIE